MSTTKNLIIIGGGFAGTTLAKCLDRSLPPDWMVTLISRENFITYNPLLPEVVGASLLPGHVVAPHRLIVRRGRVCMATVSEIDIAAREVRYLGEGSGVIPFDQLVIACGVDANLALVPGMADYALPLKTLGDALFLRNRVISRLEQASMQPDPEARRWLTTFLIVGGGFSGVEVAGEIRDFLHGSMRYYPMINPDDCRVILLHSGERLLPEISNQLGGFAGDRMMRDGIEIRLNTRAARVDDRCVTLASGESILAGTVICTIGTAPNQLLKDLTCAMERGRISTDPDMSVPGYPGVWSIGDCAAVTNAADGRTCPPTAQFADRQARQLAQNVLMSLAGRPTRPFRYRPVGQLCSVGHNKAVVELFGMKISGFVAWLLWRGVYLLKIPTLARKARLFLEWNWAMFFPPDIVHFNYRRSMRRGAEGTGP